MKKRFYINTEGNDDEAYREAMKFACDLANEDPEIQRVILLAKTKGNVGWLDRLYSSNTVKKLFKGTKFDNCKPGFIIKTVKTYKDSHSNDIVIAMALDSEDIMKIDNYYGVKAVIAIPWMSENIEEWVKTWKPVDIRTEEEADSYPLPDPLVQEAMNELTRSINRSTGITHPSDEKQAKTYIRALYKYSIIDGELTVGYLVRELGWDTGHAGKVKKLIDTLNNGKYFKGGDKTYLKNHINRWKENIQKAEE